MTKRFPTSLGAFALFAATVLVGVPAQAAIITSSTAQDIANALNGTGASVTGTFTAEPPSGTPAAVADTALASFPTQGSNYGILTTGNAAQPSGPQSVNASTSNGGGNVRGNSDFDVSVLKVDLSAEAVGDNTCLRIDFRFLSEEFPEYVGSAYNDAFIAELDSSNWTTSGSSIDAPNNFAFDPNGDPITINSTGVTNMTAAEANGTVYDGATPALVAQTSIAPNAAHSVYLSIFDAGDDVFDSAVFLDNLTLGTETGGQCPEGAKPNLALSLTTDLDGSTTPGVTNVALNQIPPTEIDQQGSPTQDAPIGKSPIGKSPIGKSPIGKSPIGKSPIGKSPIGKSPIGKSPIGKSAVSAFPLLRPGGWQQVLANSCDYQTAVPQAVSFAQLLSDSCALDADPGSFPEFSPGSTDPLTMDQINWALSPAANASMLSLLLGDVSWADVAAPSDGWCAQWVDVGGPGCGSVGSGLQLNDPVLITESNGVPTELTSLPVKTVADIAQTARTSALFWGISVIDLNIHGSFLGGVQLGQIPNPELFVDCTRVGVSCASGSTQTLGNVFDLDPTNLSALRPDGTLGALGMGILGQRTLSDITLAFLDPTSIAWEDASLAGIPFETLPEDNPTTLVTYRLSYEVPCFDSSGMDATVELPDGFRYRPGSSTASVNSSSASIGDPTVGQDGALTWDLSAFACTGPALRTIEIEFKVMPGLDVGTGFSASASVVSATTSALVQQAAPVEVASGFGNNGAPAQAAGVSSNSLVFGHLPNPGDQAFFEFSADPGDLVSVSLSHLSHDYDLVLYAPSGAETASALRAATPVEVPLGKGPLADPLAGAGSEELLVPEALQDVPLVSNRVVAGISDFRGTEQEFVSTTGVAGTGGDATYLVQVSQNNADHGPEPFVLTIRTTTPDALPACSARTVPNTSTIPALPLPTVTTSDNTLIVVDSARLEAAYGADAATIMAKLSALAAASGAGVSGKILDLAAVGDVRTAFSSLDADPCSPAKNNDVVRAINDAVDSLNTGGSTLSGVQNIVLIGDDALLPHARIADGTTDGNEREFAGDTYFTGSTNALGGAFGNGYFLSDAPYGSLRPLSILRQTIYPMQVATGRLGGSASTIIASIQRFIDSDGIADPRTATTDSRTALETDYDFFRDGGDLIHQSHQSHVGPNGTAEHLSDGTTPWDKAALASKLINDADGSGPNPPNPPHLISPNAHYDQYRLLPAEQDANGSWQATELLTTADIHGLTGTPYHLRLVYGIGCHFGLDFPDSLAGSTPSTEDAPRLLDWPQTYLDKGAAVLVGNLGFGFGDTATVAFSERLMANFAENLDDSATVGQALVKAEKDYLTSLASISPYDLKVLQQTIMWGLPMYAMPGSSGGGGSGPTAPNPTPLIGNVDATTVTVAPTFHQSAAPDGTRFFDIGGLTQATHPYPIVPKVVTDLPTDGQKLAKGAFLNAGTITEQSFTNAYTNATIDQSALEPATPFPTIYPTTYQSIGTTVDRNGNAAQTFVLVPGQFRSGANAQQPNVGTFRKLTTSTWTVTYGPSSDVTGPTFVSIDGAPSANATAFTVELQGAENDDAVVQVRVAALFVGDGDYHVVDLTLGSGSSNSGTWIGTLPNDNVREFTVFALDSEGNVSTANNRGRAYAPQDDEDAAITRSIGHPSFEVDGDTYVTSSTPITVTVSDAGTGIDHCEIDILGPVSVPSPACGAGDNEFTLPGTDGAYAIQVSATDNNGNQSSLSFDLVVDTSGPTFGTCPTPEFVVLNQNGGSISYSVTADDGIGLGAGPVLTQTLDTTTVGIKTLTFTAVDALENEATLNCIVGVRYNFAGFQSPVDNPPIVNSAKAGQSVPVKFRLTDATGAPVTAPVSFAAANWKVSSVATTGSCGGTADAIETYAGSSGWQSLGNGVYQFNWATPTSYRNQCRTMKLDLADGTAQSATAGVAHIALFRFVK